MRGKLRESRRGAAGFTLLETLVVLFMVGLLAAIATPSWLGFADGYRLSNGLSAIVLGMRQAQTQAVHTRKDWRFSIREVNGIVQWTIHPDNISPGSLPWHSLDANIRLDPSLTTLFQHSGIRRLEFNHFGRVSGQLGRVTLMASNGSRSRRCVFASTLLGVLRTAKDRDCG